MCAKKLGLWVFCCWLMWTNPANAQEYQKAKQILDCVVRLETVLRAFPDATASPVTSVEKSQILKVLGKQGNWLDVQTTTTRGWISTFYVEVRGVSRDQNIKVIRKPKSNLRKVRNESEAEFFKNARLVPYLSYGLEGRDFYQQIRLGFYGTYKTSDYFSVGVLTEAVLFRGTYFAIGPTFHRLIPTASTWFFPSISASMLYYSFDRTDDSDKGFGVQWAIENDFPMIRRPKFIIKPMIRAGFDVMIVNIDPVRIPLFFSLGATMQF